MGPLPVSVVTAFLCLATLLTPRTMASTTRSNVTDDQRQRNLVECVIENHLSSDGCKGSVHSQMNQDLQQMCTFLVSLHDKLADMSCTIDDYNKLHKVLCEYSNDVDVSCATTTPATTTPATTAPAKTTPATITPATTTPATTTPATTTPATTTPATTTPAMTDEEKQRQLILSVIENDLSSDQCKTVVKAQAGDPNQDLKEACNTLELSKPLVSVVGCSADDYDKLHKVICEYCNDVNVSCATKTPATTIPATTGPARTAPATTTPATTTPATTTPATTTPAMTDEEKQRQLILSVIENDLSSDQCKNTVKVQAGDPNQDLKEACNTLEMSKPLVSVVGCSADDYDKLHKVICEYVSQATTKAPAPTTTRSVAPPTMSERDQIEKVQKMIQNELSSPVCSLTLQQQLTDDLTLAKGCELLETAKALFGAINCTEKDYAKLHAEVCDFHVDSGITCDPDLPQWREDVLDVIDNKLSPQCGSAVKAQADDSATPDQSCQKLLDNKNITMIICTQDDFDSLNNILCGYENRSAEMKNKRLKNILQSVGSSCSVSVSQIVNNKTGGECERIVLSRATLVNENFCTRAQMTQIEDNVCNKGSVCGDGPRDPDSRENRVQAAIKGLSGPCQLIMNTGTAELSGPSETACEILKERKDGLIRSGSCSQFDYIHLYVVVCSNRDSEGDEQINKVINFLANNLTASCFSWHWPRAESLAGGLEKMCSDLKKEGDALVRNDQCSSSELDKLKVLLCPLPMDDKEKAQRAEIDRVVAEDLTANCKSTMEVQVEAQRNEPLEQSCALLRSSRDLLSSICSPDDISKIESATCGGGGNSAVTVVGNVMTLASICFVSYALI